LKKCSRCCEWIDQKDFGEDKRASDGLKSACKPCSKKDIDAWRTKNTKHVKLYSRSYLEAHREQIRKNKKLYRLRHPERAKAQVRAAYEKNKQIYMRNTHYRTILKRFGLNTQQVDDILSSQGHVCKICGGAQNCGKRVRLYADHCHKTGRFRAFLCFRCNSMLGFASDCTDRLQKGILYLNNFKVKAAA
jgi:hypothetical protein